MTTNENLFELGLMNAFDEATRDGDKAAMVEMPIRAQIGAEGAE